MQLLQQSITPSAEELLLQCVINVPAVKAAHQNLLFLLEARYSPQPGSFTQTRFLCNVWGKHTWLLEARVMVYLDWNSWGVKYIWITVDGQIVEDLSWMSVYIWVWMSTSEMSRYLSEVKCKGGRKKKKESVIHKEFVLIWRLRTWTFFSPLWNDMWEQGIKQLKLTTRHW